MLCTLWDPIVFTSMDCTTPLPPLGASTPATTQETVWSRMPKWRLPSFTCRKSTTWDRRLYFPSEGRRAEDFLALKNPDGFGRVWTRELGYLKASTLPLDHRSRYCNVSGLKGWEFCLNSDIHVNLGIFYMPQIYDMEPTALLPLRRKACWGFSRPKKSQRLRPGLNPRTWVLKGSTLPLDHRSRYHIELPRTVVDSASST